ncbi:MAG TPA: DUF11 domain-containing protein [Candidatus Acidoferrales bacterium]|nr:DUF11 domain-containing protein [Candidatus Acidoferrales bacterium]
MPTALRSKKHLATLLLGTVLLALPAAAADGGLPLYTVSSADSQLRSVDPVTGRTLFSLSLTLGGATLEGVSGLARDPKTGGIFALLRVSGQTGDELVVLDPATGAATRRGNTGDNFVALFFAPDGTLYAVTSATATTPDTVFILNLTDGTPQRPSKSDSPVVQQLLSTTGAVANSAAAVAWRGDFLLVVDADRQLFLVGADGKSQRLGTLDHAPSGLLLAGDAPGCSPRHGLYGAAHQEAASLFYFIDQANGAATLVGPMGFEEVTAMDFGPGRRLFAIGRQDNTSYLLSVDPCTGLGTVIGPTGLAAGERVADLTYRKSDRTLFALIAPGNELASVDTTTGALTRLGAVSEGDSGGLASDASGELVHAANSTLWRLNAASFVESAVAPLTFTPADANAPVFKALDSLPTGALVALVQESPLEDYLAEVDPVSGVVTLLGSTQPGLATLATPYVDPDLILSMVDGTDPVPVSSNLVYTLTVANIGPDQATGVTLVDTLPANTTFQSASIGTGSCAHSMGVVTCTIGNIAAAASVTATITIQATMVGTITNNANVTLTEVDPNTANNSAKVSTTVVDFTISVAPASVTVTLGNSGSYTITLMPVGGRFDNSIGLSCTSPPTGVTCVFQPASPAPGAATITSALTVRTTAGSSGAAPLEPPQAPPPIFIWLVVTAALLGWLTTRLVPALRGRLATLGVVLALLLMLGLQVACSNSEETAPPPTPIAGTPRGTHTITVRGNFGSLEHNATTMLVVQ